MKLRPRQRAFCQYYVELGEAKAAALKAGYSEKTATEMGYENLSKPHLAAYIKKLMDQKENSRIASAEEVLQFLTEMSRGNIQEETISVYKKHSEIVKKQATPRDRIKAAELLGKRYALFTDRMEANVSNDIDVTWGEDNGPKN